MAQSMSGVSIQPSSLQTPSSGIFSAPSGLSDSSAGSSDAEPSFSIQAPGYSEASEESDEEEVTSAPVLKRITPPTGIELALLDLQARMQQQMLAEAFEDSAGLQRDFLALEAKERQDYAQVEALMQSSYAAIVEYEAMRQASLQEGQKRLITGLQEEHLSQAQAMDQKVNAALKQAQEERQKQIEAEAKRREAEKARLEEEAQRVEQEAQRRQEEAERKSAEEQRTAAAAQAQAAQESQAVAEPQSSSQDKIDSERRESAAEVSTSGDDIEVAIEAAAFERRCKEALKEAQEAAKKLDAEPSKKADKRTLFRSINTMVTQIGGTQQQVDSKSSQIIKLLDGLSGEKKAFAMLNLSRVLLNLAEEGKSRFPVAEVAVLVCNKHSEMLLILLGRLHEVCPLAVPKAVVQSQKESLDAYLGRWAFKRAQVQGEDGALKEGWEDLEAFLLRLTAHVQFYAAFCQSDSQAVHGAEHGWAFLSRLLNALTPSRFTAFALVAFVEIAGYKLFSSYRAQFTKLLMYIDQHFVEVIIRRGMEEARSAVRRLRQYLQSGEFQREPEGRRLAMYDESSYERA